MLEHLDPRVGCNFVDTNGLHRDGPEAEAIEAILELHQRPDHDFLLLLTESVKTEIEHPHTPLEVKLRALRMIWAEDTQEVLTGPEKDTRQKVRTLIQGNAKPDQHDCDAFHLIESARNGGRHFITNDSRLLKKADELWTILQLRVVTPSEWLAAYNRLRTASRRIGF
jgi:hypothetical protein